MLFELSVLSAARRMLHRAVCEKHAARRNARIHVRTHSARGSNSARVRSAWTEHTHTQSRFSSAPTIRTGSFPPCWCWPGEGASAVRECVSPPQSARTIWPNTFSPAKLFGTTRTLLDTTRINHGKRASRWPIW